MTATLNCEEAIEYLGIEGLGENKYFEFMCLIERGYARWERIKPWWYFTTEPFKDVEMDIFRKSELDTFRKEQLENGYTMDQILEGCLKFYGIPERQVRRRASRAPWFLYPEIEWNGKAIYPRWEVNEFIRKFRKNKTRKDLRIFTLTEACEYLKIPAYFLKKNIGMFPDIFTKTKGGAVGYRWQIPEEELDQFRDDVLEEAYFYSDFCKKALKFVPSAQIPGHLTVWGDQDGRFRWRGKFYGNGYSIIQKDVADSFLEKIQSEIEKAKLSKDCSFDVPIQLPSGCSFDVPVDPQILEDQQVVVREADKQLVPPGNDSGKQTLFQKIEALGYNFNNRAHSLSA